MNLLQQTYATINSTDYNTRYASMDHFDGKTHVLYLAPFNNATGLYRAIIPSMELNKTQTHAAIVNQVEEFSEKKQQTGFDVHLNDDIIKWADYIVFQTSFHDLQQDVITLRDINKKSHLKFVMDIDDNYHIPVQGQNEKYAKEMREQLLKNMIACNIVTCSTLPLMKFYVQTLQEYCIENEIQCATVFMLLPNLMSNDCYTGIFKNSPPSGDKIRIGMSFNPTQFMDINQFRKTLLQVNNKYGNKVELICFGWNGKVTKPVFKNALDKVKFTHVPVVPITDYFQTLVNLNLNFCLMPLQDNEFNRCKTHHKLLQYSQLGIPAICSDVQPYSEIIAEKINDNGSTDDIILLPHFKVKTHEEWLEKIDYLVNNPDSCRKMAYWCNAAVQESYTWHSNPDILPGIFKL